MSNVSTKNSDISVPYLLEILFVSKTHQWTGVI